MIWYLRSRAIVRLNFRGVTARWELFADILKVGVPGLINIAITNLSVVMLTGIAGQLGRDTALGYAMGARLEYILQPIAFGFGTALVAMVGTNWGARQYRRAREIAWTGAATVAALVRNDRSDRCLRAQPVDRLVQQRCRCRCVSARSIFTSSARPISASGWAWGSSTSPRASAAASRR